MGRPVGSKNKPSGVSKATAKKAGVAAPVKDVIVKKVYICVTCGVEYTNLEKNFYASQSPLFGGWRVQGKESTTGRIPVCKSCIDHFVRQYTEILGNEDEAIKRIALKLDLYYSDSLLEASKKRSSTQSRIAKYISSLNMSQNMEKNYDTYLEIIKETEGKLVTSIEDIEELQKEFENIGPEVIAFWGMNLPTEDYVFLQNQYDDWTNRHPCKTKAQEATFQNICMIQLQISKAIRNGDKIEQLTKSFSEMLATANLQPKQNKDNSLADQNTFGTLIQKWENERPLPEPEPEWKDVDGIGKYIKVWMVGHLCKMLGIRNSYCEMYEAEIAKYTVDKPQYEDDTDDMFEEIFGHRTEDDEEHEMFEDLVFGDEEVDDGGDSVD